MLVHKRAMRSRRRLINSRIPISVAVAFPQMKRAAWPLYYLKGKQLKRMRPRTRNEATSQKKGEHATEIVGVYNFKKKKGKKSNTQQKKKKKVYKTNEKRKKEKKEESKGKKRDAKRVIVRQTRLGRIFSPRKFLPAVETAVIREYIFGIVTIRRNADRVLWTQQAV